jgi:hypothetical protein
MLVIAPKHKTGNGRFLDGVQLGHQLRKQRLACLIKQRPPCFFAILRVNDADTVRSFLWPIVRDVKGTKDVFLSLQPFPGHQRRACN